MHVLTGDKALEYLNDLSKSIIEKYKEKLSSYHNPDSKNDNNNHFYQLITNLLKNYAKFESSGSYYDSIFDYMNDILETPGLTVITDNSDSYHKKTFSKLFGSYSDEINEILNEASIIRDNLNESLKKLMEEYEKKMCDVIYIGNPFLKLKYACRDIDDLSISLMKNCNEPQSYHELTYKYTIKKFDIGSWYYVSVRYYTENVFKEHHKEISKILEKVPDVIDSLNETLIKLTEEYSRKLDSYHSLVYENDDETITYTDILASIQILRLLEAEKLLFEYQKQGPIMPKISVDRSGFPSVPSLKGDLDYIKNQKENLEGETITNQNRMILNIYKLVTQIQSDWKLDGTIPFVSTESFTNLREIQSEYELYIQKIVIEKRIEKEVHKFLGKFIEFLDDNKKRNFNRYTEKHFKFENIFKSNCYEMYRNKKKLNITAFYKTSFDESDDYKYFLAILNRRFCFDKNNKKRFLKEISMNRYKFKHPLLGDDKVELTQDMAFSYYDYHFKKRELIMNIHPDEIENFGLDKKEFKSLIKI